MAATPAHVVTTFPGGAALSDFRARALLRRGPALRHRPACEGVVRNRIE